MVGCQGITLILLLGLSAILGGKPDLERNVQAREMEGSCHQPPFSLPPDSVQRRLTKVSRKSEVAEAWVSPTLHLLGQVFACFVLPEACSPVYSPAFSDVVVLFVIIVVVTRL